jgi:hypothetical protein
MGRRIGALLAALIAAVLALLAGPLPSSVADVAATAAANYTYDTHHTQAQLRQTASERGPPASLDRGTTYGAVDRWSHGASAHPSETTPPATYEYDHSSPLVPVAGMSRTTAEAAEGVWPDLARSTRLPGGAVKAASRGTRAAKGAGEAGALVRYDAQAASRNLLGQVGEGYARTPSGYTVSAHAAERIVYGAPGRSPTTLSRVDDILNNPTKTMMRANGTIRVYQGKDWVAVRDTGPIHIVTVMVR